MSCKDNKKIDQIERGKRIKFIRENELHMTKTALANVIGVSSQFLGLVEDGRGNLVYNSIKKLREISGHSADYILYGLDDSVIEKTKICLKTISENELLVSLELIKNIATLIKDS